MLGFCGEHGMLLLRQMRAAASFGFPVVLSVSCAAISPHKFLLCTSGKRKHFNCPELRAHVYLRPESNTYAWKMCCPRRWPEKQRQLFTPAGSIWISAPWCKQSFIWWALSALQLLFVWVSQERFTVRLKGLGFLPFGVPSDLFVSRVEFPSSKLFLCDTRCSVSQTDRILQNLVHKPRICWKHCSTPAALAFGNTFCH